MYDHIQISKINDFIFCPYSIYLHGIYESFSTSVYHSKYQTRGKITHESIDQASYSTARKYLQGISVFSEKYGLVGKIDVYDREEKILIERKYKLKEIYTGYKYQLYAQYFGMIEEGYDVEKLLIHSLADNKRFKIDLPNDLEMKNFEQTLKKIRNFQSSNTEMKKIKIPASKCNNCIYRNLCAYSNAKSE